MDNQTYSKIREEVRVKLDRHHALWLKEWDRVKHQRKGNAKAGTGFAVTVINKRDFYLSGPAPFQEAISAKWEHLYGSSIDNPLIVKKGFTPVLVKDGLDKKKKLTKGEIKREFEEYKALSRKSPSDGILSYIRINLKFGLEAMSALVNYIDKTAVDVIRTENDIKLYAEWLLRELGEKSPPDWKKIRAPFPIKKP